MNLDPSFAAVGTQVRKINNSHHNGGINSSSSQIKHVVWRVSEWAGNPAALTSTVTPVTSSRTWTTGTRVGGFDLNR